ANHTGSNAPHCQPILLEVTQPAIILAHCLVVSQFGQQRSTAVSAVRERRTAETAVLRNCDTTHCLLPFVPHNIPLRPHDPAQLGRAEVEAGEEAAGEVREFAERGPGLAAVGCLADVPSVAAQNVADLG